MAKAEGRLPGIKEKLIAQKYEDGDGAVKKLADALASPGKGVEIIKSILEHTETCINKMFEILNDEKEFKKEKGEKNVKS